MLEIKIKTKENYACSYEQIFNFEYNTDFEKFFDTQPVILMNEQQIYIYNYKTMYGIYDVFNSTKLNNNTFTINNKVVFYVEYINNIFYLKNIVVLNSF